MMARRASERLAWGFILPVSGVAGVLYAVLTIFGWIHGWEGRVALAILLAVAALAAGRAPSRPVLHGFVSGFLAGLLAIELQAAFLPFYFTNNPEYAQIEIPFGLPARLATAVFAPIHAALAGLLTAGAAWILLAVGRAGGGSRGSG